MPNDRLGVPGEFQDYHYRCQLGRCRQCYLLRILTDLMGFLTRREDK